MLDDRAQGEVGGGSLHRLGLTFADREAHLPGAGGELGEKMRLPLPGFAREHGEARKAGHTPGEQTEIAAALRGTSPIGSSEFPYTLDLRRFGGADR